MKRIIKSACAAGLYLFLAYVVSCIPLHLFYKSAKTPNCFEMHSIMFADYALKDGLYFDLRDENGKRVVPPDVASIMWHGDAVYGYREDETMRQVYFYYSRKGGKLHDFASAEALNAFLVQQGLPKFSSYPPYPEGSGTIGEISDYYRHHTKEIAAACRHARRANDISH